MDAGLPGEATGDDGTVAGALADGPAGGPRLQHAGRAPHDLGALPAVIFPAGVLLAAFGAEALTRLLETGIMRARTRTFGWVPQGLVALVLVAVTVAGLPSLYAAHKDDWKDATRIALHSRDGTAIVAVGVQSSWVVQNMGYYFALEKTSVPLLDVTQVDAPTVEDLR